MSIENVRKLELGMDMSCNCEKFVSKKEDLTDAKVQQLINEGGILEEEAMKSGDIDVLERAFDYFLEEENDDALSNGGCETLESDIFQYFSWDQIFSVLKGKLDKLIELNSMRAEHFVCSCDIGGVKELMSTLQLSKAMEFLSELQNNCRPDLSNQIGILLEDMKKW